eukprot:EG_transcript_3128
MDKLLVRLNTPVVVGQRQAIPVKQLGEGAYSVVFACRDAENPEQWYALKRTTVHEPDALARVEAEVDILRQYPHPTLITYYDHAVTKRKGGKAEVLLLMEYAEDSLLSTMQAMQRRHASFSEAEALHILGEVAQAVAHLHAQAPPIAHRDLKVENVLCSRSPAGDVRYKLCDFGSCSRHSYEPATAQQRSQLEEEIGRHTTLEYRAPEMVDLYSKRRVDQQVDVWALGVLLYYLLFFRLPFEEGALQILHARYAIPDHAYSAPLIAFLRSLLTPDPAQRPTARDAVRAAFALRRLPEPDVAPAGVQPGRWSASAAAAATRAAAKAPAAKVSAKLADMLDWAPSAPASAQPTATPAPQPPPVADDLDLFSLAAAPSPPPLAAESVAPAPAVVSVRRNSDPFAESPVARRAPKPQATVSNALFGLLDWQTDGRGEEAGLMAGDPDHDHDEAPLAMENRPESSSKKPPAAVAPGQKRGSLRVNAGPSAPARQGSPGYDVQDLTCLSELRSPVEFRPRKGLRGTLENSVIPDDLLASIPFSELIRKCVIKATSRALEVKGKYMRRLIILLWRDSPLSRLYHHLSFRPLVQYTTVCYKTLILVHKIINEAPPTLQLHPSHMQLLRFVGRVPGSAMSHGPQELVLVVGRYAGYLRDKMEFCQEAADTVTTGFQLNEGHTVTAEQWQGLGNCCDSLLTVAALIVNKVKGPLRAGVATLVTDLVHLYTLFCARNQHPALVAQAETLFQTLGGRQGRDLHLPCAIPTQRPSGDHLLLASDISPSRRELEDCSTSDLEGEEQGDMEQDASPTELFTQWKPSPSNSPAREAESSGTGNGRAAVPTSRGPAAAGGGGAG